MWVEWSEADLDLLQKDDVSVSRGAEEGALELAMTAGALADAGLFHDEIVELLHGVTPCES